MAGAPREGAREEKFVKYWIAGDDYDTARHRERRLDT